MIATLLRHTSIPLWAALERSDHLRVAARLERDSRMSADERQTRQLSRLRALLEHAGKSVPFYRDAFRACGFEPGDLRGWADFARLPTLRKSDIRDRPERLVSETYPAHRHQAGRTTGSTGMPLQFVVGAEAMQYRRAVRLQRDRWTGWRDGEWRAFVRHESARGLRAQLYERLVLRRMILDDMRAGEAQMEHYARRILRLRPTLLFGHAHAIHALAVFWRDRDLPTYRFRAILSTGMLLAPHERRTLETVFDTGVFDRYGCEELGLIATECEAHAGLHTTDDTQLLEIVPDRMDPPAGRVVVTDLTNDAMPFIRYELGDLAEPAAGDCPCGRSYPRLRQVRGRVADYLWTPAGHAVSGIALTEWFADLYPAVAQGQLIQDRLDHLRFRVVRGARSAAETTARIAALVRERFGAEMRFDVEWVDAIAAEPNGKFRFTICELERARAPRDEPDPRPVPQASEVTGR